MLAYPFILEWMENTQEYLVTFPDVPEAATVGANTETAKVEAVDALLCAFGCRIQDGKAIPLPSIPKKWAGNRVITRTGNRQDFAA